MGKYGWLVQANEEVAKRDVPYTNMNFIPYGSFLDGTLGRGSQLCVSMTIDDTNVDMLELKKDIKKALISNSKNSNRYAILEEEDLFSDFVVVKDRNEGVVIRLDFDKSLENSTTYLMLWYF